MTQTSDGLGDVWVVSEVEGRMGKNSDITWFCTGNTNFGWSFSYQATHPKRVPVGLTTVSQEYWYFYWGDYQIRRVYEVRDNHSRAYTYLVPIAESYVPEVPNGCSIAGVVVGTATTNSSGRFSDVYGNWDYEHPIPWCTQNPNSNCSSFFTQYHNIDTQLVLDRTVEYRCDRANVNP